MASTFLVFALLGLAEKSAKIILKMVSVVKLTRLALQIGGACRFSITTSATTSRSFSKYSALCAAERRYTEKHEWVSVDGATGIVGISSYAQEALGDVVFAQLPDPGTSLSQHDECGALESVKAASEIYSPVSGKVIEKNDAVEDTPALVNSNCYDKGWLFKLTLSNPKEIEKLMSEQQYAEFLKSAEH